ncbi:MAG TPA: SGNH/GDSL hydrolase family protein [Verrucomicrobiae bacterium]|nr:SGNH/GDSL hydrolase family protein [Verrucomicrobiae bacterium]
MRARFLLPQILAISLPFIVGTLLQAQGAEPKSGTNRWEPEIEAFERADKTNPPPQHALLFIGSSSIRIWPDPQRDFPNHTVFKRGFGGSELSDAIAFADRIVIPYKPKLILLYEGDNDIAAGKSPERIFSDFKAFVQKVHAALPETPIAYIAVKPCPDRKKFLPEVRETNRLIRDYTEGHEDLSFVDIYTPMLNPDGSLRPELFLKDGLHMNKKGYAIWVFAITPLLDRYDPPAN